MSNNNTTLIVGGLAALGITIGGLSLATKNAEVSNNANVESQTQSVINLPATNARLDSLEESLNSEKEETERDLEQLYRTVNDNINRRELETYDYVKTLDEKNSERIDDLEKRIYRLEQEIFDQVPNP